MNKEILIKELQFKAVRSSGAGGQHVNKTSSKVILSFDVLNSQGLSEEEKVLLQKNLGNRLSQEHILQLTNSDSRSQHSNKEAVIAQFFEILSKGLTRPKKRIATKVSKAQKQKRLDNKQKQSSRKQLRKKPDVD